MASTYSYPNELNPFDDDDSAPSPRSSSPNSYTKPYYPERLNPFDSDDGTLSPTDYDNSLNPFEEEEGANGGDLSNTGKMPNNDNRHSSVFPTSQLQNNIGQPMFTKSSNSQPHLTVSNVGLSIRLSPSKRQRKRAAPKPPSEQSPVHDDEQPSSLTSSKIEDRPLQSITSHSDDNPSLSYSSIQSSSSQIILEAQQLQQASLCANDARVPSTCDSTSEDIENSDNTVKANSSQLTLGPLSMSNKPPRAPSPAIRRSLNSMNSMNRSSSSLSYHRDSSSANPSSRSHDGSMTNVSDDFRPIPLPRTKSLLKKGAKLAADISSPSSQNLKEKLENLEVEPKKETLDQEGILIKETSDDTTRTSLDHLNNEESNGDLRPILSEEISELPTCKDEKKEEQQQHPEESSPNSIDTSVIVPDVGLGSSDKSNLVSGCLEDSSASIKNTGSSDGSESSLSLVHSSDRNAALWRKIGLKKRAAPPLPVNYKRQVFGSIVEIEDELNEIGDNLVDIEKRSLVCKMKILEKRQHTKVAVDVDTADTQKFVDLIKEKCNLARRQKELMYRKREHILDQSHSDIEYELRMIGNKQASHRTEQDDTREQELLKRLVEIIEEKNDIVENLIRDNSISDEEELHEALNRLDIKLPTGKECGNHQVITPQDCDRNNAASSLGKALSNGRPSKQDKNNNKGKNRPSTTKALKSLKKYGKMVVKISKKEDNDSSTTAIQK